MGAGSSKYQGQCGAPTGQDPRVFALTKIHKVPNDLHYLNMYFKYTTAMACDDIASWRKTRKPVHQVTKYHKILKKGLGGAEDPRTYAFTKIYHLSAREIRDVSEEFYTKDMAVKEIRHQEMRKTDPSLPKYRYKVSRGIRFTNTKHDFVYKEGRQGYTSGVTVAGKAGSSDLARAPHDPKVRKSKNDYIEAGRRQGIESAAAHHALHKWKSAAASQHQKALPAPLTVLALPAAHHNAPPHQKALPAAAHHNATQHQKALPAPPTFLALPAPPVKHRVANAKQPVGIKPLPARPQKPAQQTTGKRKR